MPATVDPHQDNNPQELNSNTIQEEPEEESTSKAESSTSSQENRASNFVEPVCMLNLFSVTCTCINTVDLLIFARF